MAAEEAKDVDYKTQILRNWRKASETKDENAEEIAVGLELEDKREEVVVLSIEDESHCIEKKTCRISRNGGTIKLDTTRAGQQPIVHFPKTAMMGRHGAMKVTAARYTSVKDLQIDNQQFQVMFNKTLGMVAAIIELNDNDNEDARFDDFIQIVVPHNVPDSELRYVEVLRSDNRSCQSLPTGLECRGDDDVDAYFTAGEQYITIFTKTFSFYTCCKGQRSRLDLKAWLFCTYNTDTLEIKVYLSDDNPKEELLRSGQLRSEEIVLVKWRTIVLPDEFSEFTQKDKLRFLLVKNDNWTLPVGTPKRADKLVNLVECKECLRKSGSCPKDAATFELVPNGNLPQTLTGFIDVGSLHIVVRPHATESCWTWVKKTFFKSLWKKERRLLDAMPISDELRQSTEEPLFGVTDFTLRIKFSDVPCSDSGLGAEHHRDEYLRQQAESVFSFDNETVQPTELPGDAVCAAPISERPSPSEDGARFSGDVRNKKMTKNIPFAQKPMPSSSTPRRSVAEGASCPNQTTPYLDHSLVSTNIKKLDDKYLRDNVAIVITDAPDFMNLGLNLNFTTHEVLRLRETSVHPFPATMNMLAKWSQRTPGTDKQKARLLFDALWQAGNITHANVIFMDFRLGS